MDEKSPTSEGCAETTGEGKAGQADGEANAAIESNASSSEQLCAGTVAVPESTAPCAEQPFTMNKCPVQENIEGGNQQEVVQDDAEATKSKDLPSSSDQAVSDPGMGSSITATDIPKTTEDCALPDQDMDSCEERTSAKLHPPGETTQGDEDTSLGLPVELEESCQSSDTQQSPKDLVQTNAELGLPTKLSDGKVQTVEGSDETTSEEITTNFAQAPPKDESCGIKDKSSIQCTSDQSDSPLDALEHPKSNLSSVTSSNQSAKTCFLSEVTSQGQCNEQDSVQSLPTSSNMSLPSPEPMQIDSKCSTKVEDTANNNVQKCTTSCQEPQEGMKVVQGEAMASPEKPIVTDPSDCATVKVQKVADEPSPCVTETVEAVGSTQNRSLLMKYLGLQPVQEGGKTCSKDVIVDVAPLKPRLGNAYLDSFGLMPGLDLMNPYDKGHISYNTSPFEVCSDGSHSPEPPLLAETPVVGSSPPHHDYDAMEARMMDMTPRVDSGIGRGDLLSSFPHSQPPSQDTKTAFNRKQLGASGYTSSHALDSLCHRLAERVEPDIPDQDHTVSQGTKLSDSFYSIPDMKQKDCDIYGSKTTKFSSMSEVVPCPRCHRTFKNRNQLRGHLRWHINDPINLLSGRWPKDRSSSHEKDPTTGKSSGKVLDKFGPGRKKTKSKAHLDTEQKGSTQDAFPCTLCTKVFRTSLKLRGHMMVHKRKQPKKKNIYWRNKTNKGSGPSRRGGRFQCEICSEKYESQLKLSTHMTTHAKEVHPRSKGVKRLGRLESSSVGNGPAGIPNMRQKSVLGKRKAPFKCDICFKTFLTLRARNGHKGIHSSKWKLANSLNHLGRPVKIKEEPCALSPPTDEQFPSETVGRESDQPEPTGGDETEQMNEADENPNDSLSHRMRKTYFKCIHCHLVFASRHRVRKHLFKVHSIVPPGSDSFTEEKVDGCKFCEVFKKRKRGRPKRGENTLIQCPHGKIVVGYNLPLNSVRLSRQIRCTPKRVKTEEIAAVSPEDVLQQKCIVKLSPVDVNVARERRDISKDNSKDQVQTSEDPKVQDIPVVKKRGRPPKNCLKPANTVPNARKMVFSVGANISRRGGTRALSTIRRRRMGKELSLLGRQLKSGWDPKRQRFIGRPYKCHLCKMSYRSERQLCSHMRSHGIHIFDLSQLPADQRGNAFMSREDMETKSDGDQDLDTPEGAMSTNIMEGITATPSIVPDLERTPGESGVGGTCAVCKKEFDSDNMFHQHLLGRYNKKCRQEWMNHTFGFGMRNKVKDASEQDFEDEHNPVELQNEQSNGNLYVIDKINMESFQGSGIFSNLQQKVNDKIENVLQREKLAKNCSRSLGNTESKDTEQASVSTQSDAGLATNVSQKKGSVLNAVINRLTQSSKPSNDIQSTTPTSCQSSKAGKKPRKGSDRPVFKCHICNKAFDRKQKLSVHAMIHRPKVATVMDHVEIATQRSGSGISTLPSEGEKQQSLQDQVINDCLGTTAPDPVAPMHLIYSCTECPKQFTSNLKLASHLKMHMKSTMSRSPKRDPKLGCKPQDVKGEQVLNTNKTDVPTIPMEISTTPVLKTHIDEDNTPNRGMPSTCTSQNELQAKGEVTNDGNACDSTEPTFSGNILKPGEIIPDVPMEQDVNKNEEKSHTESEQISTSRPRLLLKINPATLQRLYDCPECSKSFKSRRQLAHHQKIHHEEKVSSGRLEGDDRKQSDSCTTLSTESENSQPDCSELVSHSYESEERTASVEPCPQDLDQSSVETVNHEPKQTNVNMEDNPVHAKQSNEACPPEKIVPCKICDKVMKKSQLGGHMKSHTKELLSRKFTRPEHAKSIMNKEIISGVDLYRSVSRKAESTFEYPSTETVNGIAATANGESARDAGPGMRDMYDYEEEIQDEDAGKQQFTCRICNTKYNYYEQLCQHLKMHVVKNPNFNESAPPSDINEASLMEEIDDEQAPNVENGEPTFARPKVYPCELCGFSFSSFRQFRVHISETHGGKYQYRLMIQQKEAAKAGAFLKEPDTINKTHPHKCDVCGRRFKRLALLIFHLNKLHKGWKQRLCMMNVRSRPRPPHTAVQKMPGTNGPSVPGAPGVDPADLPFTCELCGKSFRMKVQLCGHMKTHGRVGHSPIKITPLAMKGKYTLRKSRKPDFRLSDEWILDMDDERMAFENSMALQQLPPGPTMIEQPNKMKGSPDASMYASMYAAKPIASNMAGTQKIIPGLAEHTDKYRMPMSSPELPMTAPALDLKIPVAPPPPEPSKFITIQMEPVMQQMLHRCLLCHSYFSSQESAVQHCKEVHFKKRLKAPVDAVHSPAYPLGQNYQMSGAASGVRPHSALHSSAVRPARPQMSPSLRPPVPQRMHCTPSMVSQVTPGVRSPTSQAVPCIKSPGFDRVSLPPTRFPVGSSHSPVLPYAGTMPKAAPTPSPSAKTISQTPFNEMLYRVETSEGQTRYVCNTCKSTFLHYNFLMSHLADHNHLAYTCLQCGYATYSEKDYQLHCQLHDGQISKKIRRVRPKPPGFASNSDEKGAAPRAVATCHICQRSFVNMKGLKAHMVLHSANYNSISERRNENKRVQRRSIIVPVTCFNEVASEPLSLLKPTEEQTEALDLTVKPVVDSSVDEVLDLSMGPRSFTDRIESPLLDGSLDMTIKNISDENQVISLPDVCQVMQQPDISEEPTSSPTPPPAEKLTHVRKPKNSIRLVGAIDVDVASLENKYSVCTDLMDSTDSDISPDVPLIPGQESPMRSTEGEAEHDGKSPKKARNFKCSMCQYATDFRESMERHEMKHRKFRTLACHQCSYRTPEKRLMLRHVLTIHEKQKPYECKLCPYSSAYKHHLKRHHTKRHQQPLLTCSLCEFTSDDVVKMKDHSASHPSPKVYQCKLCPMVFNSSKLFKAHKQIVHHKKKKSKKSSRDKSHSSSGVTDSSESAGGKEMEGVANPEEPQEPVVLKHPCNLCKYQTDDQNELTIHLMKKHFSSQIKEGLGDVCSTAQCPQCGYLTGKEQMKAHMQIHDSGELFNCDQCLFKACSQEEVDDHVQQKHKVKLAPTQLCKMCGMHFWNAEDMKQHTEMHLKDTSISVKNPFLCNMCPLKLMNRRDALRHLQLHTDRYPFKCRHCVFSCFTKASIQRHLAIHRHSNSKPKSLTAIRKNGRKSHSMGASASSGSESDAQKSQRTSQSTTC